jgi:hypothetical protein
MASRSDQSEHSTMINLLPDLTLTEAFELLFFFVSLLAKLLFTAAWIIMLCVVFILWVAASFLFTGKLPYRVRRMF